MLVGTSSNSPGKTPHSGGERKRGDENSNKRGRGKDNSDEASQWKSYKDPETGSIFWHNVVTKASQWECPLAVTKQLQQPR